MLGGQGAGAREGMRREGLCFEKGEGIERERKEKEVEINKNPCQIVVYINASLLLLLSLSMAHLLAISSTYIRTLF